MAVMKKLQPVDRKLPGSRLYIDDIDSIVHLLRETGCEIELEAEIGKDTYKLDSPADIGQLPRGRIKQLQISASHPNFNISLGNLGYASIPEPTTNARGALEEILELIASRRPLRHFLAKPVVQLIGLILVIGGAALNIYIYGSQRSWTPALAVVGLGFVAELISLIAGSLQQIVIVPRSRKEGGFWRRNRDALIIATIASAIGAVLGAGLGVIGTLLVVSPTSKHGSP